MITLDDDNGGCGDKEEGLLVYCAPFSLVDVEPFMAAKRQGRLWPSRGDIFDKSTSFFIARCPALISSG